MSSSDEDIPKCEHPIAKHEPHPCEPLDLSIRATRDASSRSGEPSISSLQQSEAVHCYYALHYSVDVKETNTKFVMNVPEKCFIDKDYESVFSKYLIHVCHFAKVRYMRFQSAYKRGRVNQWSMSCTLWFGFAFVEVDD
ncbi:hypothetical protein NPIL_50271 [Nephila pilipes]|uniref:Uncharacterized protein n=1 Tax=Nephila pilipes TaxID=299642 RepID=A0A8X6MPK5_NEPPI|nr:hypothetical protein NPIL_50271 [Nephila pilipes]